jgi:hypothetical protein
VGRTFFERPVLHRTRDDMRDVEFEVTALLYGFLKRGVGILRELFAHYFIPEN